MKLLTGLTYGAEHELADWAAEELEDRLPDFTRDTKDITVVNSNGIANDPKLKLYKFGGEINTPPTETIGGQCKYLVDIREAFPEAKINYRSNLHWHIRVPGLADNLRQLKNYAQYNAYWLPKILDKIEPIPDPKEGKKPFLKALQTTEERGAQRRYKRRRASHHTVLPERCLPEQMLSKTVQEFFEAEVPKARLTGKPMWHAQPRAAVNLRQLLQTETIEFRHFPGTLDPIKLAMVGQWCYIYTCCALADWAWPQEIDPVEEFLSCGGDLSQFPVFEPYDHSLEIRYRATCHDKTLNHTTIKDNIYDILHDQFDDEYWDQAFNW